MRKSSVSKIRHEKCYGCYACSNVCPAQCIEMKEDKNGFAIPEINDKACMNCGVCLKVCPAKHSCIRKEKHPFKLYAANIKDERIWMKSTSGGMFYPMAEYVINRGGCVYGAAYNKQHEVEHICAECMEDVERCMRSKYVQSNVGKCYREIAQKSHRQLVLFTGTPCQVEALSRYPKINRKNLILVDFICHGVPSPKLWQKYLDEKAKKYGVIETPQMRIKDRYGAAASEIGLWFKSGEVYRSRELQDSYMKAFVQGISLRGRCYNCKYKGFNRASDLTIADFHNSGNYIKDADTFRGLSLLLINSQKGENFVDLLKDVWDMREMNTRGPLIDGRTWGLSFPYSRKRTFFYDNCFRNNLPIDRSLRRAALWEKRERDKGSITKEVLKEMYFSTKRRLQQILLIYFL